MHKKGQNITDTIKEHFPVKNGYSVINNNLYSEVFNFVTEGIISTDIQGFVTSCNKSAAEQFGYDRPEEMIGLNLNQLIVDEYKEPVDLIKLVNKKLNYKNLKFIKKNGETFFTIIQTTILTDENGIPIGYVIITNNNLETTILNEQLNLLVTALESTSNEVVITDNKGDVIWVNSSFSKVTGYSYEEIIGKNPRIFKSGVHSNSFYKKMWDTISSGNVWSGEITNKKKNGEIFIEEMTITPLTNNNEITNYIAIKQDVTEKKNVERNLLESELKYRSLFENSTIGIYRADSNGNIIVANNRFLEILGLSSIQDLKNVNVDREFYQSSANREKFLSILKSELKIYGFEAKWKTKDGRIVYIRESATAFKDNSGKFDYYEGTIEDITDIVEAKREIQKQTDLFSALRFSSEIFLRSTHWSKNIKSVAEQIGMAFDVSKVYICKKEINAEKEILFSHVTEWQNPTNEKNIRDFATINLSKNGLLRWEEILSQNSIVAGLLNEFPKQEKKFLSDFEIKSIILVPILLDGIFWGAIAFLQYEYERVWTDSEIEALRAAAETFSSAIKRHNFENELIQAKKEAEFADKTKSEFLAQISHEIRTPLNNIVNFNTLIKEQLENNIDDEIQECFDVIDSASNRLIRTIGLILNLSELHTGSYKKHITNFDVYTEILEKLYLENRFIAKERNIQFQLTNNAKSTIIQADKYSLEQIFSNLIDNSLKYTSKGKIEIAIENDSNNQIVIKISDTGIGIAEEYLPNIFKHFSQEEGGYSRKYDGNGIGLSLVKEYCDLNNIQIEVSSKKNIGTTFTLTLKSKEIN